MSIISLSQLSVYVISVITPWMRHAIHICFFGLLCNFLYNLSLRYTKTLHFTAELRIPWVQVTTLIKIPGWFSVLLNVRWQVKHCLLDKESRYLRDLLVHSCQRWRSLRKIICMCLEITPEKEGFEQGCIFFSQILHDFNLLEMSDLHFTLCVWNYVYL